jgi:hypothetical protein
MRLLSRYFRKELRVINLACDFCRHGCNNHDNLTVLLPVVKALQRECGLKRPMARAIFSDLPFFIQIIDSSNLPP